MLIAESVVLTMVGWGVGEVLGAWWVRWRKNRLEYQRPRIATRPLRSPPSLTDVAQSRALVSTGILTPNQIQGMAEAHRADAAWVDWGIDDYTPQCVPFIPFMGIGHNWKYIGDPVELDGGGCCSNGLRYECQDCGKTKDRWY